MLTRCQPRERKSQVCNVVRGKKARGPGLDKTVKYVPRGRDSRGGGKKNGARQRYTMGSTGSRGEGAGEDSRPGTEVQVSTKGARATNQWKRRAGQT